MGNKRFRAAALFSCLLGFLAAPPLPAQAPIDPKAADPAHGYFYTLDSGGEPVFTQVLRWEADPDALEYRIILKNAAGEQLLDERTSEPAREVHLAPGSYEYKILSYNLLGRIEAESDWLDFDVVEAEQPVVASVSPKIIDMDALDGRVTIIGQKLVDGVTVALVDERGERFVGKVVGRDGDGQIVALFPDKAYRIGVYSIYAENPGGLSSSLDGSLRVRFQRPVDFLASVGFSPFVSLSDAWFKDNWTSTFNPLGLDAQLELFFIKQRWGLVGIELGAQWRRLYGGEDAAKLTSDFVLAGADLLYKYRFTRRLHGLVRLGGGFARSYHSFEYDDYAGPTATSYDPYAQAGLALQAFLPNKLFGEIGADCSCVFFLDHYSLGITPRISVGYQIY
jgi:hypothetical protein